MRRVLALAAMLAVTALAVPAEADLVERAAAKEAYDRGVKAHGKGDFANAAKEFATADSLAPSPTALQAALEAVVETDLAALAGDLLERSKREKQPRPLLATAIEAARKKFGGRGGFVRVMCPGTACTGTLDATVIDFKKPNWAPAGTHSITMEIDGDKRPTFEVEVKADETIEVAPPKVAASKAVPAPEAAEEPAPAPSLRVIREEGGKLSPVVFWIGAGVTVALAATTTAFAVMAGGEHQDFIDAGCTNRMGSASDCTGRRDDGEAAQLRTNVVLATTLGVGAATAVIGLFFTRWRTPRATALRPGMTFSF